MRVKTMNFKLCYIDDEKDCAYFTSKKIEDQNGDDWNDAPYERNAGKPYDEEGNSVKKVYFELSSKYNVPRTGHSNSPYSVKDINNGVVAWLWTENFKLFAGTSMDTFINTIKKNNGKVYLEIS